MWGVINRVRKDSDVPYSSHMGRKELFFLLLEKERIESWSKTSHAPCLSPSRLPSGNLHSLLIFNQRRRAGVPLSDMTPRGPGKGCRCLLKKGRKQPLNLIPPQCPQ